MQSQEQILNTAAADYEKAISIGDIMPPDIKDDKLIRLIAERFFKCGEMTSRDCVFYAQLAANVVRSNTHLILLKDRQ